MGKLEKFWLDSRHKGPENLSNIIESTLAERRARAMQYFDDVAEGMQFHLPSPEQLRPFAKQIAQSVCSLPPVSDQETFRTALSEIFGAAVQIIVEKPNGQAHRRSPALQDGFEKKGGIVYAFNDRIRRILLHDCSLLPDIQAADENEIANFFPADCWQFRAQGAEQGRPIVTLMLKSQPGRFNIPPCRQKLLIVLRYYCAVPEGGHVRIRIHYRDRQLYLERIWQSESFLWVAILPSANDVAGLHLFREVAGPNGEYESNSEGLAIAFAGAFPVD
jgi:hypothetical protein